MSADSPKGRCLGPSVLSLLLVVAICSDAVAQSEDSAAVGAAQTGDVQEGVVESPIVAVGDRVRVRVRRSVDEIERLVDGRFWLVEDGSRLLVQTRSGGRTYIERIDIITMEKWIEEDRGGLVRAVTAIGWGLVGGWTTYRFGEGNGGSSVMLMALGAAGGAGTGWIVGHAFTSGEGVWQEVSLDHVFGSREEEE